MRTTLTQTLLLQITLQGTNIELGIYRDISLTAFVQRLLNKRCVSFVGPLDHYLLLNGASGLGAKDGYVNVGTKKEKYPLTLYNVLSYDEIKLSAFLSVSSHTEFINDGNRKNCGEPVADRSTIESDGVIIGLIGSRFQKQNQMDCQDIIIGKEQNTSKLGYGHYGKSSKTRATDYRRIWCDFYEEKDFLFKEAVELAKTNPRFKELAPQVIFDNVMMKKRYTISFDTLLLEAEARGAAANKQTYIHVVGIGLGVWRIAQHQTEIFLKTFWQRLHALLPSLKHVGVVHFSWFRTDDDTIEIKDNPFIESPTHPLGGIQVFFSDRNPAMKLPQEHKEMLVVESYAWDPNALPGNEFWHKSLHTSGDPAAACSTLITELHNPHINVEMVSGENLHIATEQHGIMHLANYANMILRDEHI